MSNIGLTQRQLDLLRFIERYYVENDGRGPSFEEMRAGIGLGSRSGIHRMMAALEERGHVTRMPNRARCVALVTESAIDLAAVPLPALAAEMRRRGFAVQRQGGGAA